MPMPGNRDEEDLKRVGDSRALVTKERVNKMRNTGERQRQRPGPFFFCFFLRAWSYTATACGKLRCLLAPTVFFPSPLAFPPVHMIQVIMITWSYWEAVGCGWCVGLERDC